jgi:hypothetical protein
VNQDIVDFRFPNAGGRKGENGEEAAKFGLRRNVAPPIWIRRAAQMGLEGIFDF